MLGMKMEEEDELMHKAWAEINKRIRGEVNAST